MESSKLNSNISHYRILSQIGAGGMGEVYLAEDTRLYRKVALKLLLPEFISNEDRLRRFIQEARAAAALNHPNIAHIYEVGEADGTHYIAMEFVDGDTLVTNIRQSSLAALLKHLPQVAEGLAKAHAAGIVHRDLKPDNIMITRDGYVKILDFGLAKLVDMQPRITSEDAATAVMLVQPISVSGTVMGTVGYMSPEQAQGKPVDQRSDIFSFGCVLYEASVGRRPFDGESAIDTLHKIIYSTATPITDLNPSLPADLQRIVRRCLAKEPERRYQTIRDVANDLEDLRRDIEIDAEKRIDGGSEKSSTADSVLQPNKDSGDAARGKTDSLSTSSISSFTNELKAHKLGIALILIALVALATAASYFAFYAGSPSTTINSLAVMPFVNLSNDADVDYLSDGMTETLISNLSRLPKLSVKARSSVFRFKGKEANPRAMAKSSMFKPS